MGIKCITKLCMYMNSKVVPIRLKTPYIEAYEFLKKKKMKPANLLRTGGQELLITTADKFRKPLLIKIKEKYF